MKAKPLSATAAILGTISLIALLGVIFFIPERLIAFAARYLSPLWLARFASFVRCGRKRPSAINTVVRSSGAPVPAYAPQPAQGAAQHYYPAQGAAQHQYPAQSGYEMKNPMQAAYPAVVAVPQHPLYDGRDHNSHHGLAPPKNAEAPLREGWARYEDGTGDVWYANAMTGACGGRALRAPR